jgi:hypothetical protein
MAALRNGRFQASRFGVPISRPGRVPPAVPSSAAQRSRPSGNLGYYTAGNDAHDDDIPRRL